MALPENVANSPTPGSTTAITTLGAALTTTNGTSITTAGAAPAALTANSGQFRAVIDSEIILVTSGATGTTWTIARGQEGSTAATHSNGASIYHDLTAYGLEYQSIPRWESMWMPSGAIRDNFPRHFATTNVSGGIATGTLIVFIGPYLLPSETVSNISFYSGTTAAGTPVNQWFALFDQSLNLLKQTADDTSTAWAANTKKTLALSSSYTAPQAGIQTYFGILVKATTTPTFIGSNLTIASTSNKAWSDLPTIAGTSTTGLTTPGSFTSPASALTAPTTNAQIPYGYVS